MPGVLDLFLGNQAITLNLTGQEIAMEQGAFAGTLEWVLAPAATVPNDRPFDPQPSVRLLDGLGIPMVGVTLTLVLVSGNATRIGTTVAVTNGSGIATWTDVGLRAIGPMPLSAAVRVQALTLPNTPSTSTVPVTVQASTLAWIVQPPATNAENRAFSPQPSARLLDGIGNPISGASITLELVSGNANRIGTTVAVTNTSGIATWADVGADLLVLPPGGITVRGVALGIAGQPATPTAAVSLIAVPASLSIIAAPTTGVDGQVFGTQPQIRILDQNGNPYPQDNVAIVVELASGSGVLLGDLTVESVGSDASFTDLAIDDAAF